CVVAPGDRDGDPGARLADDNIVLGARQPAGAPVGRVVPVAVAMERPELGPVRVDAVEGRRERTGRRVARAVEDRGRRDDEAVMAERERRLRLDDETVVARGPDRG